MKINFTFSNGTSTLVLAPETAREKSCIQMFREGGEVRISAQNAGPESLALVTEIAKDGAKDARDGI